MHRISVLLNRQQLELLDRTLAKGLATDRAALLKLALREYGASRTAPQPAGTATPGNPAR
jgi:metal-responsive CopG/Arc/MetJ family transcriptional regulator